jgi:HlyD family secretion protein
MKLTRKKKIWIGVGVVALAGAAAFASFKFRRTEGVTVNVEEVRQRDLEALVSASGKIQPKRFVNISADTMGRVTNLAVEEGDLVKRGQFLLQIDPRTLQTRVQSGEAALAGARAALEQTRTEIETARQNLQLSQETLKRQRELWAQGLSTKDALDRAESEAKVRASDLRQREQMLQTQQLRLGQERAQVESARYDLSKVRILSPFDGVVTRRNIEEGETVVIGTMNNPGTVLLTIADMSVIEAEVEVDETDIPSVKIGQTAKITIDAIHDKTFAGRVTEIGNSPIQVAGQAAAGQQATNFKVVVTLDGRIPEVRPGFTCSSQITTAKRGQALAVPIQAMAVRELIYDKAGNIVRQKQEKGRRRGVGVGTPASAEELPAGQTRKEIEGVFVVRDGQAVFVPVKTGIPGEKHFEVLSGLKKGDKVITGPFNNVRNLQDGDKVKTEAPVKPAPGK